MKQKTYLLLPLLLAGAAFLTTAAWAGAKTADRVGKTSSITLDHETQVGDMNLPAGDYTVRDRVVGTDHFMIFQRTTKASYFSSVSYDVGKPLQVGCRMEPLAGKVSDTTVSINAEGKLSKIEHRGRDSGASFLRRQARTEWQAAAKGSCGSLGTNQSIHGRRPFMCVKAYALFQSPENVAD